MGTLVEANASDYPPLKITRVFDAPRELVFKAWTDAEHLKRWWGPRDFTNPVCEIDVRRGGAIRIDMRSPDGTVYPMTGVVQEVSAPERIVFTSIAMDGSGAPLFEILNTVLFSDENGKTKLTIEARVLKTTADAGQYLDGMEEGWTQSLDRLAEVLTH
jgi:uncharacterized protein YndB with AHSA1/START domain